MATATAVDANVAVRAVFDRDERAASSFRSWTAARIHLVAPDLWLPEAISALRRTVAAGAQPGATDQLLDDLFALPVTSVPTDRGLATAALEWAGRLGRSRAHDGLYLAVAERHATTLVTADERLLARCRQLGIDFVEGLPELTAG